MSDEQKRNIRTSPATRRLVKLSLAIDATYLRGTETHPSSCIIWSFEESRHWNIMCTDNHRSVMIDLNIIAIQTICQILSYISV